MAVHAGFGGTFDQYEACKGQDSIVLRSDASVGASPDGVSVYAGGMIFCCAGQPYDVVSL